MKDALETTEKADEWGPCPDWCPWMACTTCPKHREYFATVKDVVRLRRELNWARRRIAYLEKDV